MNDPNKEVPRIEIRHLYDLFFSVVAEIYEYRVDYKIYAMRSCGGIDGPPRDPTFSCAAKGRFGRDGETDDIAEADLFLHGFVKWDGCSNWHFDDQNTGMMHACSREELANIGNVLTYCWDWTSKELASWY